MKSHIIGLSGTNGSGKDSVGAILAEYHNYMFITVTDLLREEGARRGLPVTRETTRTVSVDWRRQYGPTVLVDRAMDTYKKAGGNYAGVVISSLRNPLEADRIHHLGGIMIWTDADPKIRYQRIRAANRGRPDQDNRTYEQFLAEQEAEMHPPADAHSDDTTVLNMAAVKERCDITIVNDSSDLNIFRLQIEKALGL